MRSERFVPVDYAELTEWPGGPPAGVGRFVVYTRDEDRIRQLKQTIID